MTKPITDQAKKQTPTNFFSVALLDNGIVHVRIKGPEDIDIEKAKQMIEGIGEACGGIKRPVLVSADVFSAPTAEARVFLAKKESNPYALAAAYIARSLAEKIVMNAFLKFNKPARPTKMFTNEAKAMEWLTTFL